MIIFICLIALAWLIPNHYAPWTSAWNDGVAIFGLLFVALFLSFNKHLKVRISAYLIFIAISCSCIVIFQFLFKKIHYFGDAWIVFLYINVWLIAVFVGSCLSISSPNNIKFIDGLVFSWVFSALISVGIGLVQWNGLSILGIYGVEMPWGGRPFANVAQPNNLCTILFIGVCGSFLLYQKKSLGKFSLWLAVLFLIFGMVMTQSRTGWLQIFLLTTWVSLMHKRASLSINPKNIYFLSAIFIFLTLFWANICDFLYIPSGRILIEQVAPGPRLPYWRSMLEAIIREPVFGYGWNQIGIAQQNVALSYPATGALFEHSHNIFLDFILTSGIFFGGLISILIFIWFYENIYACKNSWVAWALLMVMGVFVHAMLEFPLDYAYFLIPVGILMGLIDGFQIKKSTFLEIKSSTIFTWAAILFLGFFLTLKDYSKSESIYRNTRYDSARIGVVEESSNANDIKILTQISAFLKFMKTEATPGMKSNEVKNMQDVAERFGYPPVLFRFALASALNGQPKVAYETLEKICRIHEKKRCQEAREGWIELQEKYPQLTKIDFPNVDDGSVN